VSVAHRACATKTISELWKHYRRFLGVKRLAKPSADVEQEAEVPDQLLLSGQLAARFGNKLLETGSNRCDRATGEIAGLN
jgi:hypothetical protein